MPSRGGRATWFGVVTLIGMSAVRKRVNPAALRRDLKAARNHRPRPGRAAFGVVGLVILVVFDGARLWTSPIAGSAAWWTGTLVGGSLGVAAAVLWFRASRGGLGITSSLPWWAWATGLGLLVTVVTVHGGRGTPLPPIDSTYRVGALWYDVIAMATVGLILVPMHFREIRTARVSRRPDNRRGKGQAPK